MNVFLILISIQYKCNLALIAVASRLFGRDRTESRKMETKNT